MTQERTHTRAVGGNTPLIQLWLEAVLCAFASLAQGVATTLGMRFNRTLRDWHTKAPQEALPQAKLDIQIKDPTTPTESFSALCRESLLDPEREFADTPREAINQDPRDKAEDDTIGVAALCTMRRMEADPLVRVPGVGRGPVLRAAQTRIHRSALTRAGWTPAFAGDADARTAH